MTNYNDIRMADQSTVRNALREGVMRQTKMVSDDVIWEELGIDNAAS